MRNIALIGVGAMGAAMGARWIEKGFALAAYNRRPEKAAALAAKGAKICDSPREAAGGADIVVSMVVDDEASRAVWLGSDGALAGLKPGAIAVEASTVSPPWVHDLAKCAHEAGAAILDAPVGGGPSAAAAGNLVVFVGGPDSALDAARPVLAAVGRIEHLGGIGAGATWKLINYMMAGAQLAGLAEALALAAKAGVDPARAAALIANSVVASPAVIGKLPRMVERRFGAPDAALRLVAKDQRYALELARALGANLEILPVVAGIYARAAEEGLGDLDLAAVAQSIARRQS